ncbi:ATP-dependent DNA helicase Q-like 3 [Branchiostoma floridae]|uniref:ATP-dependent DNA helicase Q-like 3 n=1 Tax=Branchiostoma floridae TaxID=7739 RepID=A0A9J7HTH0_BRAFL|nr:ATP-dependent DNA helicase Q-like 3 [Branchiostoma floridae]
MALTASATPEAVTAIIDSLSMKNVLQIKGDLDRSNIFLVSKKKNTLQKDFLGLTQALQRATIDDFEKHLVYVPIKNQVMEVWRMLRRHASPALRDAISYFHSSMSSSMKGKVLAAYKAGTIKVLVATVAFGMVGEPSAICLYK